MSSSPSESSKALEKAEDALKSAEYDVIGGFTLAAANRAYYSCYYCMVAMLYTKDVYAKTHQGLRAKFTELFIKESSAFPSEASDIITMLFNYRQEADYDLDADITIDEARLILGKATEFYNLTVVFLQKTGND